MYILIPRYNLNCLPRCLLSNFVNNNPRAEINSGRGGGGEAKRNEYKL